MIRLLFDRSAEPRYIQAFEAEPWTIVKWSDAVLPPTAKDEEIVDYAVDNNYVIFARDDDFFKLTQGRDCGFLFFMKSRQDPPHKIVAAVDRIRSAYRNPADIEEGLPGAW